MYKDVVGLAKQAVLGTKITAMEHFPGVSDADRGLNQGEIEQPETTGTRFPTGVEKGVTWWAPSASGPVRYASFPRIVSCFMGQPVTTTPDAGGAPTGRKHAFASGLPKLHSVLFANMDPSPTIVDLFYDALGNELALDVNPNGFMTWRANWLALNCDDTQPDPVVVRDTSKRISFAKAKAYISVNGGGESEIKLASWGLTYSNGISPDDEILGQNELYSIQEGNASCTVRFSPRDTLSTHYRRALKQDPDSVKIRLVAIGPNIGGAINHQVEAIVNACEYIDGVPGISAADRLKKVDISARAKIDDATGKFVDINVQNTVNAY